jgi:hypothetical protein
VIEGLSAHLGLLAFAVSFFDQIEAGVGRRSLEIKHLSVVKRLADPEKLLQIEFDRFISCGGREQRAGVERADTQTVGLFQIVKLVGRDHAAGARFVGDIDARLARQEAFDMARNQACRHIRAPAGRRADQERDGFAVEEVLRVNG